MIDFKNLKILVLDDEPVITNILHKMLLELGVGEIMKFHSPFEASACLGEFTPNVILSDIDMPEKDGFEFIRDIRFSHPDTARAAVIFLTGYSDTDFVQKAKKLRIDGYLLKPVKYEKLYAALGRVQHKLKASGSL